VISNRQADDNAKKLKREKLRSDIEVCMDFIIIITLSAVLNITLNFIRMMPKKMNDVFGRDKEHFFWLMNRRKTRKKMTMMSL
jgi:hypothetical protein